MHGTELSPTEHKTLAEKFKDFIEAAKDTPGIGWWLSDPLSGLMAYVRDNVRLIGPPENSGFLVFGPDGLVENLSEVRCLEIASLERTDSIEAVAMTDFLAFMGTVSELSPWGTICLENIGDPRITDWCMENGWIQESSTSPDFFYTYLPAIEETA